MNKFEVGYTYIWYGAVCRCVGHHHDDLYLFISIPGSVTWVVSCESDFIVPTMETKIELAIKEWVDLI